MKHYNYGIDIDINRKRDLERYFEYRWQNNKNSAIDDGDEIAMLTQLPEDTQIRLYRDFLYREFMQQFSIVFRFPKPTANIPGVFQKKQFYSW